jgi:predicted RNA-binding protein Jag
MSDPKEELQRDVERTRRELGETVEALAHKVDVPGRVKEQAHETKVKVARATNEAIGSMAAATNQAVDSLPEPVAVQVEKARRHPAAIAAVLITLIVIIWKISRRNG